MADLWATKAIDALILEAGDNPLKRTLGSLNLMALGVAAIVGSGIFVLLGIATARFAGPAVLLSFVFAAVACVFTALCYAEFASMVPIAGSAYTYSYATLGELVAWIVGWDLVLEYGFGAAAIASGWSGYVVSFLGNLGITLPPSIARTPWEGGVFNLPAFFIVIFVSVVLYIGVRESARLNNALVAANVSVLLVFVLIGGYYAFHHPATAGNWHPFIPPNTGAFGRYGWSGIFRAAAFLFFAYLGFDVVSSAAQEAKNPNRDVGMGILGSLAISTVLYLLVAAVLIGLVNYTNLDTAAPLALGMKTTGLHWPLWFVTLGAIGGLTSTVLVMLLGQSRVLYAMSRDGLLPEVFGAVHPRFRTPHKGLIVAAAFAATLAALVPIDVLTEMVSIGTLLVFTSVCLGVWFLRRRKPDLPRSFRTPWVPVVPIMGILGALAMAISLTRVTWIRLGAWFVIGMAIYFGYGRRHSRVQQAAPRRYVSPSGELVDTGGGHDSPEQQFMGSLLHGLLNVLGFLLASAAVLIVLSFFFSVFERRFNLIAVALSATAILAGFLYAIAPDLRSLWLLRRKEEEIRDTSASFDEKSINELIEKMRKGSYRGEEGE